MFFTLDHEITPVIFKQLNTDDLKLLCPIIGQRFKLEKAQTGACVKSTNVSSSERQIKVSLISK